MAELSEKYRTIEQVETALDGGANAPKCDDTENRDFAIGDEQGNVIVDFSGGHIRTKNFDSRNSGFGPDIIDQNGGNDHLTHVLMSFNRKPRQSITEKGTPLVLVHFSDIHGDLDRTKRIVSFYNSYRMYVNDVWCTGDIVKGKISDDFTFWDASGAGESKIIMTTGNHDTNVDGVTAAAAKTDVYNKFFKPYIGSWGVTQPSGAEANGLNYFYKDYADQKVRVIAVDAPYVDDAQVSWFATTLEEARTLGYHVIVAQHYPIFGNEGVECNFNTLQYEWWHRDEWNTLTPLNEKVDDFIDAGGVFIAWMAGHTHFDQFMLGKAGNTNKGYTYKHDQLCINVSCASCEQALKYSDDVRIDGQKSQDHFNIVGIDTYQGHLKLYRIGCDRDRYMRHKGALLWDYINKKVLWQE